VVPSPTDGNKAYEHQDVHAEKALIASDEIIAHIDGVIDVALVLRHGGAIERNDLGGVLTDCLRDLRFSILVRLFNCSTARFWFRFAIVEDS
jgi:hypothetical protein